MRVAVFGAGGRMGRAVCEAVLGDETLELVGAVDPHHDGIDLRQMGGLDCDLHVVPNTRGLERSGVQVAVDFTDVSAARENLAWCAANGVHAVVGTTGFSDEDLDRFRVDFAASNCIIAPNFAIGAVLMMRFAEIAAPWFTSAEIIELHHDGKVDAPSGTSLATARRMAAASDKWGEDPTTNEVLDGARGGEGPEGIRVHSVRLQGLVAHQEVLLGTTGQSLTVRHDSYDRTSFMPGVLLAVHAVGDLAGVTLGLETVLGI